MLLFQAAKKEVTALPLSSSVLFFFVFFRCQVVSLFILPALPCLFLSQILICFKLIFFPSPSLSLSPVCFPILFLSFLLIVLLRASVESSIYRAKGSEGVHIIAL